MISENASNTEKGKNENAQVSNIKNIKCYCSRPNTHGNKNKKILTAIHVTIFEKKSP